MKVAIDTYPLKSAHKSRGIGFYTENLLKALKVNDELEIFEFTDDPPPVDVIHYPWFDLFFKNLPLKKNYPTVVTVHDVMPLLFPQQYPPGLKGKFNLFWQKRSLNSCKFIIADSEASKKDITKFLKIKPEKIAKVYLAADPRYKVLSDAKLIKIKRKYSLPDKFLLYVGDVNFVKNLPFLIEGYKKLISIHQDLKLILVNEVFLKKVDDIDHPELASLKKVNQLIKNYNLEDNILRPGQVEVEDLVGFYNLATVYIQPSLYEGFGLPILEAMSCGTPIVCSNQGSLPEIGGDAAVYFNPTNQEQFLEILGQLLQDKSLREKLSRLGLKQASKFSWERVADETVKVYKQAIAR